MNRRLNKHSYLVLIQLSSYFHILATRGSDTQIKSRDTNKQKIMKQPLEI